MTAQRKSNSTEPSGKLSVPFPFKATFVLNRDGDDTRWDRFLARNPWASEVKRLVRVPLVNAERVAPPEHWRSSGEQWSRIRGRLRVAEECLNQQIPSGLLVEDHMCLARRGRSLFQDFASELPFDWHWLVLAGQNTDLTEGVPTPVTESVFRPHSVTDVQAFAWRTFPALRRLYDHCLSLSGGWPIPNEFFRDPGIHSRCSYLPGKWVFQNGSPTGNSKVLDTATLCQRESSHPIVAVLGAYRGGTSCVAGVLHYLGIPMGEELSPSDSINPTGYFECRALLKLCKHIFDHPSLARRLPDDQITGLLRDWGYQRSQAADAPQSTGGPQSMESIQYVGAKHPSLCCLGPEMQTAWRDPKLVVVDRPVNQVLNSIARTSWGWNREEALVNTQLLLAQREEFLRSCDPGQYVRINYQELCQNPVRVVEELKTWLSLSPSDEQTQAAIGHVRSPRTSSQQQTNVKGKGGYAGESG